MGHKTTPFKVLSATQSAPNPLCWSRAIDLLVSCTYYVIPTPLRRIFRNMLTTYPPWSHRRPCRRAWRRDPVLHWYTNESTPCMLDSWVGGGHRCIWLDQIVIFVDNSEDLNIRTKYAMTEVSSIFPSLEFMFEGPFWL